MKSIMQSEKECYKTHDTYNLHKHHIYGGARRKASERCGCWVWLRADWHNLANYGVHFDSAFDRLLKAECQKKFEESHTREEFMLTFGKNYL